MTNMRRTAKARPTRGSTLIEVLIAMALLAMLMVGVLQLFSLSLLTDSGSAARSDMTLKAQQVAENLRYLHFLRAQNGAGAIPAGTGIPGSPPTLGVANNLPYASGQTGWAYWGPAGANVFEQENPAYRISYTYAASGTAGYLFVTVSVTSADAPTGLNYVGPGAKVKRVDYVCQVPL